MYECNILKIQISTSLWNFASKQILPQQILDVNCKLQTNTDNLANINNLTSYIYPKIAFSRKIFKILLKKNSETASIQQKKIMFYTRDNTCQLKVFIFNSNTQQKCISLFCCKFLGGVIRGEFVCCSHIRHVIIHRRRSKKIKNEENYN